MLLSLIRMIQAFRDYQRNVSELSQLSDRELADIGQFAIAELGQFADIALIIPERLDHADEREQHGSLLVSTIQLLEEASIVRMNIEQGSARRKYKWCGAARCKAHSKRKE